MSARNYSTRLAGQIGENLMVAELGRRGIIATALAGNVPDIDVLAFANNRSVAIQVKTVRRGDIQLDASRYLRIAFDDKKQFVTGLNEEIDRDLIFAVVAIGSCYGEDKFFIFKQGYLQDIIHRNHMWFLQRNNNVRPKSPMSTHCVYRLTDIATALNQWSIIQDALGGEK
jgi:hypothetical protein